MWKTDVRGILLHPTEPKARVMVSSDGYQLPGFTFCHAECGFLTNQFDGALLPGLREVYGCDLYLMRVVGQWEDSEKQRAGMVCVLEIREGQPAHGQWMDIQGMSSPSFVVPEHGELVQSALGEIEDAEATPSEQPWRRRGWFEQAESWVERELTRLGYVPIVRTEQIRATDGAAILRADTAKGIFYFKAVAHSRWFANEPVVAHALGTLYPHLVPKPLCIDADRRWMLTEEFGPTLEDPERDEEILVDAARAYGQMQLDSAAHPMDYIEGDPFGVDLERLPSTWEMYIRESKVLKFLEPEEVSALQRHLPLVKEYIRQLVDSPIPQTLVHGDLGPYNIAQRKGKPLVFDWTAVGISFPFFDMIELLHRVRPKSAGRDASVRTPEVDAIKDRLKTAYLSVWTACAPRSDLEVLWAVSEPLGFVSMALHLPFPYFPRRVLQYIDEA
jgi:hypothetical protein